MAGTVKFVFSVVKMFVKRPNIVVQSLKMMRANKTIPQKYQPLPDKDNYRPKVLYSLPFDGTWVVANGGVTQEMSHSWEPYTQRYAYDFVILDEDGKSHAGDGSAVTDYYCYQRRILAAADGVVVKAVDKSTDSRIMGDEQTDPLITDIAGNYVVIKHADGEYSFSAHFKPGSVLVKAGQKVKRGQLIALSGNSGNSTEPHLHFHIQNGKSFLSSAGLPISFRDVESRPCPGFERFDARPVVPEADTETQFITRGYRVKNRESDA